MEMKCKRPTPLNIRRFEKALRYILLAAVSFGLSLSERQIAALLLAIDASAQLLGWLPDDPVASP